jgi:hypothetical protein
VSNGLGSDSSSPLESRDADNTIGGAEAADARSELDFFPKDNDFQTLRFVVNVDAGDVLCV